MTLFHSMIAVIVVTFLGGSLAQEFAQSGPSVNSELKTKKSVVKEQKGTAESTYLQYCASCHQDKRLGAMGPALLPQNLGRLKKSLAKDVILNGRPSTQMPGFSEKLSDAQVESLVDYIYTEPLAKPIWSRAEIEQSHIVHFAPEKLSDKPVFKADMMNLFMVVELGDHHASVLDGDSFDVIHRFPTRYAVHGGPKYSQDGRYVYFASRDGWISKFDLYNLKTVAEVRAGINTRNAAVSLDNRYVAVGNYLPHNLVILNASDLSLVKVIDVGNDNMTSRVSAVYTAPKRNSFIVALKDVAELWELPYKSNPDWKIRKIALDNFLDDFFFDQDYRHVIGAARPQQGKHYLGGQVVDLDKGIKVADLELPGMPHLGSGISWQVGDKRIIATPNLSEAHVSFIDTSDWSIIKTISTMGPGFFTRSHEQSPYAWIDVFFGPNKDKIHIVDKESMAIVKTLQPEPGKTAAHVEFTKNGDYALVSIWEDDGALIVYDAKTFEQIKRIPMKKPSGKYNVYNKTRYEEGTSH